MINRRQYTGDGVIERGYEIYDEWNGNQSTSQDIVRAVEHTVTAWQTNGTNRSCVEALAYLFALDMRIREKYDKLVQYFFSYSSFRREIGALKLLKSAFHIPDGENDIRTAIEIELQKLRKRMETEDEDEDEGTHGGRSNKPSDEEASASGEEEQASEDSPEQSEGSREASETSEASEEPAQEMTNPNPAEAQAGETVEGEIVEQPSNTEIPQQENEAEAEAETEAEVEAEVQSETEQITQDQEVSAETNATREKSASTANTVMDTNAYRDGMDFFSIFEEASRNQNAETRSYDEDLLLDAMLKYNSNNAQQDSVEDVREVPSASETSQSEKTTNQNTEPQADNKDVSDKTAESSNKTETNRVTETEKAPETKSPEPVQEIPKAPEANKAPVNEPLQNDAGSAEKAEGFDDLRVPIQLDLSLDQENAMRAEIDRNMDEQQVAAFIKGGLDAMREKLTIASAELGIEAPVELVGRPDIASIKQVDAVRSK